MKCKANIKSNNGFVFVVRGESETLEDFEADTQKIIKQTNKKEAAKGSKVVLSVASIQEDEG
jgi:hypothetical protein